MKIRLDINNKAHLQRIKYVLGDYVMSNLAWLTYNIVRFQMGHTSGNYYTLDNYLTSKIVVLGQLIFPLLMMVTYIFSGYYNNVCRKSRVQELLTTAASAVINTLLIFFIALINDVVGVRGNDYEMILILWALLFGFVYLVRAIITNIANKQIASRKWTFPTLIIYINGSFIPLRPDDRCTPVQRIQLFRTDFSTPQTMIQAEADGVHPVTAGRNHITSHIVNYFIHRR